MIKILHRWTRAVLWAGEADSLGKALMAAIDTGADLTDADLTGANLAGADLTDADLAAIRDDFFAVLNAAPAEVSALRSALQEGRVDGSTYEGACACLVGTIANARGCYHGSIDGLRPDAGRPAECWFLAIRPGAAPEHPIVATTLAWIDEWTARRGGL